MVDGAGTAGSNRSDGVSPTSGGSSEDVSQAFDLFINDHEGFYQYLLRLTDGESYTILEIRRDEAMNALDILNDPFHPQRDFAMQIWEGEGLLVHGEAELARYFETVAAFCNAQMGEGDIETFWALLRGAPVEPAPPNPFTDYPLGWAASLQAGTDDWTRDQFMAALEALQGEPIPSDAAAAAEQAATIAYYRVRLGEIDAADFWGLPAFDDVAPADRFAIPVLAADPVERFNTEPLLWARELMARTEGWSNVRIATELARTLKAYNTAPDGDRKTMLAAELAFYEARLGDGAPEDFWALVNVEASDRFAIPVAERSLMERIAYEFGKLYEIQTQKISHVLNKVGQSNREIAELYEAMRELDAGDFDTDTEYDAEIDKLQLQIDEISNLAATDVLDLQQAQQAAVRTMEAQSNLFTSIHTMLRNVLGNIAR